jgi:hypothetical protein
MSNFYIFLMTALVFLAVVALFVINFSSYGSFTSSSPTLSKDWIGGIEVEHKNVPYVLNYDQQNKLINWINQSVEVKGSQKPAQSSTIDVTKITIYRLDGQPNIEITPLNYEKGGNLLFAYEEKIRRDTSGGELKTLLSETYDN